jgi:hypothetical protein
MESRIDWGRFCRTCDTNCQRSLDGELFIFSCYQRTLFTNRFTTSLSQVVPWKQVFFLSTAETKKRHFGSKNILGVNTHLNFKRDWFELVKVKSHENQEIDGDLNCDRVTEQRASPTSLCNPMSFVQGDKNLADPFTLFNFQALSRAMRPAQCECIDLISAFLTFYDGRLIRRCPLRDEAGVGIRGFSTIWSNKETKNEKCVMNVGVN